TLSLLANTISVGKTLDFYAAISTSRGGTATASNFTLQVLVGGVVVHGTTVAVKTTTFSGGTMRVFGKIAFTAIGASGGVGAFSDMTETVSAAGSSSMGNAGGTVDTTAAVSVVIQGLFSVAVASLSWSSLAGIVADE